MPPHTWLATGRRIHSAHQLVGCPFPKFHGSPFQYLWKSSPSRLPYTHLQNLLSQAACISACRRSSSVGFSPSQQLMSLGWRPFIISLKTCPFRGPTKQIPPLYGRISSSLSALSFLLMGISLFYLARRELVWCENTPPTYQPRSPFSKGSPGTSGA